MYTLGLFEVYVRHPHSHANLGPQSHMDSASVVIKWKNKLDFTFSQDNHNKISSISKRQLHPKLKNL